MQGSQYIALETAYSLDNTLATLEFLQELGRPPRSLMLNSISSLEYITLDPANHCSEAIHDPSDGMLQSVPETYDRDHTIMRHDRQTSFSESLRVLQMIRSDAQMRQIKHTASSAGSCS
jgi:hypothetical protein